MIGKNALTLSVLCLTVLSISQFLTPNYFRRADNIPRRPLCRVCCDIPIFLGCIATGSNKHDSGGNAKASHAVITFMEPRRHTPSVHSKL